MDTGAATNTGNKQLIEETPKKTDTEKRKTERAENPVKYVSL